MVKDVKISTTQLFLLIMVFVFGDFVLINPSKGAGQDGWIALILGWSGGFILLGIYVYIILLNPDKSFIEILRDTFGKYFGGIIALFYIWYFIHISAAIVRNISEYMITVNYPNTPMIFIAVILLLTVAYSVRMGLEVIARLSEILAPMVILFVLAILVLTIQLFEPRNLLPILSNGLSPVIKTGFSILTFPFGETVVFLVLFPNLNARKKLAKTSFSAFTLIGLVLLSATLREIMILGPDMFSRHHFPAHTTSTLIPGVVLEPLVSINLFIGGGFQIAVFIYCAVVLLSQVFNLDDYKPLVIPVVAISAPLSIWLYDDFPELIRIATEVFPYYSVPFQILIPLIILIVSLVKSRSSKKNSKQIT